MIKINDEFSAKPYNRGWELHHTTPSTNEKSKTGFKVDITFYATFVLLCKAVIDRSIAGVADLEEIADCVALSTGVLVEAITKNKIEG